VRYYLKKSLLAIKFMYSAIIAIWIINYGLGQKDMVGVGTLILGRGG
jgi:hypothetical protein